MTGPVTTTERAASELYRNAVFHGEKDVPALLTLQLCISSGTERPRALSVSIAALKRRTKNAQKTPTTSVTVGMNLVKHLKW
jgi:hypothetical protein